ncbi:MAG TPA: hypothetical protein VG406_27325, partial [Isosphaeraceae bacterium]|nr:hypothetical protein [Isosphaeraceae bacterium]
GLMNEVWNHGVYKYVASYHAIPSRGPRAVRIVLELHANSGSMLNGQDSKDRVIYYEYSLVYAMDGRVDETNPYAADWMRVAGDGMFAPLNVLEVAESRWSGHNPYVTETNVRALDLANGGATMARFRSSPPQFRSVLEYESGRAPMVASGMDDPNVQPRYGNGYGGGGGGLFRRMFGR